MPFSKKDAAVDASLPPPSVGEGLVRRSRRGGS
jgi:hypothetical protein